MIRKLIRSLLARQPQTLSSVEAYAKWAQTYPPRAHNVLMQLEEQTLSFLLPVLQDKIVLDLGGGTGRYGTIAENESACQVISLDNSYEMLRANKLRGRIQASSESIPLSAESVDVVICGLALGHLEHIGRSMNEIARVLKPDGRAIISDFHPFVALSGGQRTFKADGMTYAVEHYIHLYSDYHNAAHIAGLDIDTVLEPTLKSDVQDMPSNMPMVLVMRLRRSG